MAIIVRDDHFESRVQQEKKLRGHPSNAQTLQELAEERLAELQTGQYLRPAPARQQAASTLPRPDEPAAKIS